MTTTIKESVIKKKQDDQADKFLLQGAAQLINGFKTPGKFLEFLTRMLTAVDYYSYKAGESHSGQHICFLTRLIQHVAQPWFTGGEASIKVAEGLKEIISADDYEYYHTEMSVLLSSAGIELNESCFIQEETEKILNGIITLYKAGFCYEQYEEYIKNSKN